MNFRSRYAPLAALFIFAVTALFAQNVLNYRSQGGAADHIGGTLTIDSGGTQTVASGGILNIASGGALRWGSSTSSLGQVQRLSLFSGRNGTYTTLDATGSSTAFKLAGTVGTSTYLSTAAVQNTTNTCLALYEVVLPQSYVAAGNISLIIGAHRVVASGTTLTTSVDAEVWRIADDATAGSDICATSVQAFTNTSAADKTFTITGTTLSPGDRILIRVTGVATEGGNAGTVATVIDSIRLE